MSAFDPFAFRDDDHDLDGCDLDGCERIGFDRVEDETPVERLSPSQRFEHLKRDQRPYHLAKRAV